MKILGIETSCDETGLALIEARGGLRAPKFKVLKNLVASQIKIHRPFGGVVPNLAKREHLKNLPILYRQVFGAALSAKRLARSIDLIAVTVGPGLEPALWTGINFAKTLTITDHTQTNAEKSRRKSAFSRRKSAKPIRLAGVNHLEGHLYSFLLPQKTNYQLPITNYQKLFPAIALIVSGGHTVLLKMESLIKWKKLGETRDDAAGEAFDKVARLLGLPYPGGPEIEKLALRQAQGKQPRGTINFPRPMINDKSYDFSFSGLKTAVLYHIRGQNSQTNAEKSRRKSADAADIAASFQQAAIDVLVAKTMRAAREFNAKSIMLSGGVAANRQLRKRMALSAKRHAIRFFVPDFKYNLDNAAMIAAAGYFAYLRKKNYKLIAQGSLRI